MSLCKVEINSIVLEEESGTPIIVLQDNESGNILPILIAPLEASMIAIEMEGKKPIRPLTHDLIINMINEFGYNVQSVVIDDLKDNIYYAKIYLSSENGDITIDSRPSDSIAIALRARADIYVKKKVFALSMGMEGGTQSIDRETMKEVLEDLDIDDVGGKIM